jgi:hypothetical protein
MENEKKTLCGVGDTEQLAVPARASMQGPEFPGFPLSRGRRADALSGMLYGARLETFWKFTVY